MNADHGLRTIDDSPPPVAVLMCVYAGDEPLRFSKALASIFQQNYPSALTKVYLGVDGPLPDDLERVVREHHSRLHKIHRNRTNLGLAKTLNSLVDTLGVEKYVFRMDADDRSYTNRFETQVSYMEAHPEIDVLGTALVEVDEFGREIARRGYPCSEDEARRYIPKASPVAHPTVCFRATFFERFGRYPERFRTTQDVALWFKALSKGAAIMSVPDYLYELTADDKLFYRRSAPKAVTEFLIYMRGVWQLYGFTWQIVYPILRLVFRLMPPKVIKAIYSSALRNRILNV